MSRRRKYLNLQRMSISTDIDLVEKVNAESKRLSIDRSTLLNKIITDYFNGNLLQHIKRFIMSNGL